MKRLFILPLLIVFLFAGCTSMGDLNPEEQQLEARLAFNSMVGQYLVKYRAADAETQQKWKKDVDPVIKKAETALDLWKFAANLKNPDKAIEQQKIFLALKDEILDLLIESFVEE